METYKVGDILKVIVPPYGTTYVRVVNHMFGDLGVKSVAAMPSSPAINLVNFIEKYSPEYFCYIINNELFERILDSIDLAEHQKIWALMDPNGCFSRECMEKEAIINPRLWMKLDLHKVFPFNMVPATD